MANMEGYALNAPAAVQAGTAFDARRLRGRLVQITGTFTATLGVEGSIDGTVWTGIGSAITAPGYRVVEDGWSYVRINTTAFTSGTPVAKLGGFV